MGSIGRIRLAQSGILFRVVFRDGSKDVLDLSHVLVTEASFVEDVQPILQHLLLDFPDDFQGVVSGKGEGAGVLDKIFHCARRRIPNQQSMVMNPHFL